MKWEFTGLGKNLSKIISIFSQNTIHDNLKRSPGVLQMGKGEEGHKCYLKWICCWSRHCLGVASKCDIREKWQKQTSKASKTKSAASRLHLLSFRFMVKHVWFNYIPAQLGFWRTSSLLGKPNHFPRNQPVPHRDTEIPHLSAPSPFNRDCRYSHLLFILPTTLSLTAP